MANPPLPRMTAVCSGHADLYLTTSSSDHLLSLSSQWSIPFLWMIYLFWLPFVTGGLFDWNTLKEISGYCMAIFFGVARCYVSEERFCWNLWKTHFILSVEDSRENDWRRFILQISVEDVYHRVRSRPMLLCLLRIRRFVLRCLFCSTSMQFEHWKRGFSQLWERKKNPITRFSAYEIELCHSISQ